MRPLKSATGTTLAALYVLAFVAAYLIYRQHAGQFLADAPIMFVALPYTLTSLRVFGSVDLSGDNLREVFVATLFCAVLAYAIGALVEAIARAAFSVARMR
jgi:tryptophan-rich sensory protein